MCGTFKWQSLDLNLGSLIVHTTALLKSKEPSSGEMVHFQRAALGLVCRLPETCAPPCPGPRSALGPSPFVFGAI